MARDVVLYVGYDVLAESFSIHFEFPERDAVTGITRFTRDANELRFDRLIVQADIPFLHAAFGVGNGFNRGIVFAIVTNFDIERGGIGILPE